MDFEKLREIWQNHEEHVPPTPDTNLHDMLRSVADTHRKVRRHFQLEMVAAAAAMAVGAAIFYFHDGLEPYFLKLFSIIGIGSAPIFYRIKLTMNRLSTIDFAAQLKESITKATKHLESTIRIYYSLLGLIVMSLVLMSSQDDYFLALPGLWQAGVMGYFSVFLVLSVWFIKTFYSRRLKELRELLADV
jgi:amino acid permease